MPKNIVIYSDGTGQDGGVRPEQRMSNIFKMYRASRSGPDCKVDPREQVVFYDPGLGTEAGASGLTSLWRGIAKLLASVTGRGITTNIAECYEFIINHYCPGDRIWLFGFSRGAYTARSIATVLRLCGVPTRAPEGELPRFRHAVREIADRAVIRVAEHGAGHPRDKYEAEREDLARRFRIDHGSDLNGGANAAPYFIGAFDTVASLGAKGPLRIVLGVALGVLVLGSAAAIATVAHWLTDFNWATSFVGVAIIIALLAAWNYLKTSLKIFIPEAAGQRWRFHLAQWSGKYYDRLLGKDVVYARHAIAIDENRADFPRVPWGQGKGVASRPEIEGEAKPFVQMWFAGNHSDIGGSYPEAESRLSDIALGWMLEQARSTPHPLIVDDTRIRMFPAAAGLQHDEIASMEDSVRRRTPAWLRPFTRSITWKAQPRDPIAFATMHPSVAERFEAASVPRQGTDGPYRPEVLRKHELFQDFYR